MRVLAVLAALALAAPAAAQDTPAWVGVWDGRVGTARVRACLDAPSADSPGRGSYYYLSRLEPIALSDEESDGDWTEQAAGSDATAEWDFAEQSATAMRGTWRQGERSMPFELTPVRWTEGEWGGPCSAPEFFAPRLREVVEFRLEPGARDGLGFVRHIFVPPAHFREDVTIESFTFDPQQPGDAAILDFLGAQLPAGSTDDAFIRCFGGAISSLGTDGFYEHVLQPALITPEFMVVDESLGTFCGGAHPDHFAASRTYDRRSGETIDLFGWLGDPRIDGEESTIPDALRELVFARWPAEAAECAATARETEYWSIGLAREGLVFAPDLPHVVAACEERVTVEWRALEPFLDREGSAGLARLRQD